MDSKKLVMAAVLIAVVIAAVVITVKRSAGQSGPPQWVLDQKETKVDMKTGDVVEATLGEWQGKYVPDASGHYKNPKTGEYTMTTAMKCASCGQFIAMPDEMMKLGADPAATMKFQAAYKCPKCGKNAFPQ